MDSRDESELVGAHDGALRITSSGARATVRIDREVSRKMSASLATASETSLPDHVYLQLENVRGTRDAHKLAVYVNEKKAGTVALFGLRGASLRDGQHGGEGLTFDLDITNIIDDMFLDNSLDVDSLDVRIVPSQSVPEGANISVGRISVYRQGHQ
jgi:tyrosinase